MLSEDAYQYIIANYTTLVDEEKEIAVIKEVVNMFFRQFSKDMGDSKNKTVKDCKIIYQRMCIIWDSVATRLQKEGKPYIKKGGFKSFIESKPEFKALTQ